MESRKTNESHESSDEFDDHADGTNIFVYDNYWGHGDDGCLVIRSTNSSHSDYNTKFWSMINYEGYGMEER